MSRQIDIIDRTGTIYKMIENNFSSTLGPTFKMTKLEEMSCSICNILSSTYPSMRYEPLIMSFVVDMLLDV